MEKSYFNILFEEKDKYEFCDFNAMRQITELKIVIDFEYTNTLTL